MIAGMVALDPACFEHMLIVIQNIDCSENRSGMNGNQRIEGLNHALNREISTFLRYIPHSAGIRGVRREAVRT